MKLMSSTLLLEDHAGAVDQLPGRADRDLPRGMSRGRPQAEPRVSVSRTVIPITSDLDRRLFGADANEDQVGWLDARSAASAAATAGEPDQIAADLANDAAVQAPTRSS